MVTYSSLKQSEGRVTTYLEHFSNLVSYALTKHSGIPKNKLVILNRVFVLKHKVHIDWSVLVTH